MSILFIGASGRMLGWRFGDRACTPSGALSCHRYASASAPPSLLLQRPPSCEQEPALARSDVSIRYIRAAAAANLP
jgi:hypothetical protein